MKFKDKKNLIGFLSAISIMAVTIIVAAIFAKNATVHKSMSAVACLPGEWWSSSGQTCEVCSAGTYSDGGVNATCSTCPTGMISGAGASSCTSCPASAACTDDHISCKACNTTPTSCSGGQYLSGGSCHDCSAGTYSAGGTATSCTTCPGNTYSAAGASSCLECPLNTNVNAWHTSCSQNTCDAGQYLDTDFDPN
jgi:syndecan 4